jgi:hypothetical protein
MSVAAKILIRGSIVRAAYGILALLFPKQLAAAAGMSEDEFGPQARYFNRLFGGRDVLVAGATVAAVRAGAERHAVKANVVCEMTDTVSLVEELRSRGGMDRTLGIGLVFNVLGYAMWLRALRAIRAG